MELWTPWVTYYAICHAWYVYGGGPHVLLVVASAARGGLEINWSAHWCTPRQRTHPLLLPGLQFGLDVLQLL